MILNPVVLGAWKPGKHNTGSHMGMSRSSLSQIIQQVMAFQNEHTWKNRVSEALSFQ